MDSSADFFDEFAARFDTVYDGKRNRFMQFVDRTFRSDMFARYRKTFEYLGDLRGRSVLDIGCGSGPYLVEALRRGAAHVTGVDPARHMLALASQRLAAANVSGPAELLHGYFPDQVTIEPRRDAAIVMGVMDYVQDPTAFLAALQHSVNDGAVISFPSRHWFRTPVRKVRYKFRRCPVYFYDEATIRHLIDRAGFTRVEVVKLPGAGMDYVAWVRV
jgi:2-polyprenyl-3-methyl-5-hydroxy-6-metoxy-1,4-benzoquinol methylase